MVLSFWLTISTIRIRENMPLKANSSLALLMNNFPDAGTVAWIGVRPARRKDVVTVERVEAIAGKGLSGDHFAGGAGVRQVTLIQFEHLPVIASVLNREKTDPSLLRRNIAVRGINLLSLKDRKFRVGEALFEWSGLCHPCSRMEDVLGSGGYNAMRGHGGITARILESGWIGVGDSVVVEV